MCVCVALLQRKYAPATYYDALLFAQDPATQSIWWRTVVLPSGSSRGEPQGRKEGSVRVLAFASFGSVVQSCDPARVGDANVSRHDLAL